MDRMKIVDRQGNVRYLVDENNRITDAQTCPHEFDGESRRCKRCGLSIAEVQQMDPAHNQF